MIRTEDVIAVVAVVVALYAWDWRPVALAGICYGVLYGIERVEKALRVKPPKRIARRGW